MPQKAFKCDFNASKLKLTEVDTLGFMPPTLRLISAEGLWTVPWPVHLQKDFKADANLSRFSINNLSIFEGGKESRLLAFETLFAKGIKASYPLKNGVKVDGASLSDFCKHQNRREQKFKSSKTFCRTKKG